MATHINHLLDLEGLSKEEITSYLDLGEHFKGVSQRRIKKVPTLRHITVVLFFIENSTRTKISFEIAAKRMSADTLSFAASSSSLAKGETLLDTAKTLMAMRPDIIVIRHFAAGAPHFLARNVPAAIINAGDGGHAHPTQALLDMFTMREHLGKIEGLEVAIIGDIGHSRVARSNIHGLKTMGANIRVAGPRTFLPPHFNTLGVQVYDRIEPAIEGADVVMMLRIQKERMGKDLFPSDREYARFFGLDAQKLKLAKPGALVMHPGPLNRGVEITPDIADCNNSVILEQVENGVAIRMAVLYQLGKHLVEEA
ncbi:aspartate carbamoyltransferase catalytic subunit [Myxococcota bacterium]|jgi:aspartate carbamoyltransferase catalytic subunit|nr:aspartate carbamoyltransferase catalytic subunit [Myxococcota bacterium]